MSVDPELTSQEFLQVHPYHFHGILMASPEILVPVATKSPPPSISVKSDHPIPQSSAIPTNKFYANFFLGMQTQGTWTHPYLLNWTKGSGHAQSWGLSISHVDSNQKVYGPGSPAQYYIKYISSHFSPISTALTLDTLKAFSANLNLHPQPNGPPGITFPLVQGMGFVTGRYNGLTPLIESSVMFLKITRVTDFPRSNIVKYRILLEDGKTWLLYATGSSLDLQTVSITMLKATSTFSGTLQVAKTPSGSASEEAVFDAAAGLFPTAATLSASTQATRGTYTLCWTKAGVDTSRPLIMFALPHHVQSFDNVTASAMTSVQLQTTTKGLATAVLKDAWALMEPDLPTDVGFAPWSLPSRSSIAFSNATIQALNVAGANELSQDINNQTNLDSMYFSGKALSKFATLIYTIHDIAKNATLAKGGLDRLKAAFAVFSNNLQKFPLVYETAWKGVVSNASYVTGNPGVDFGNTYYNDHHFHYGYFIHAAAVIGFLDPTWLPANQDWVNMLVRDVANPSEDDPYFPVFRSFDWYHGHSWAKGLFESGDGKDEESSSEDAFFAYAMKMWGRTVGDAKMEARGNLMLAILARSLRNYFLMESTNQNQPATFIRNKVTGILFENKADHTTYFGSNPEYVQGIHMIPIHPGSAYTRSKTFVSEEWATYFDKGRVDQVAGGWRGILYANLAIIDPVASWKFFSQSNFDAGSLDGGASRTWYLAYAAGLGGASPA
ncbi:MAG: hypothetical protein M1826_007335 [Phylliscum demangeonii]|nr:MAG: hypothetical protein M1826_007335 [Phylliscum demangeonii]